MKKSVLALLAVLMSVCLLTIGASAADGVPCEGGASCNHVAAIGDTHYDSLGDAVAAVGSGQTTIKLLRNANGDGVIVPSDRDIVFDLNNCTYTIDGTAVGSPGYETNGFQLLRDSTITFKNGKITSAKAKILIQNYSNLTLENVTLDGSSLNGTSPYTLSNNFGNVVISNSTITAKAEGFAFDVYYWPDGGYADGVTVTVEGDSVITGKIEYGSDGTEANVAEKASLNITGGTFTGSLSTLNLGNNVASINVTGGTFKAADGTEWDMSEYVQPGMKQDANGNIVINTETAMASIGTVGYDSLESAIAAAQDKDTVKLLQNITLDEVVNFVNNIAVEVDLNGCTITGNNTRVFNVRKGNVTLTGTGTITTVAATVNPINVESSVIRVGNDDSTVSNVSLTIGAGVTIEAPSTYGVSVFGNKSTETVTVYGTINATGTRAAISGSGNDTTTGTTINIEPGAVLTAANYYAVYHPQNGTLNINGGTITGQGGIQMCAGTLNITGKPVVTALNTHQPGTVDGNDGAILDGAAVSLVSRPGYNGGAPDADIKGGTFKTTPGTDAIQVYTWSSGEESAWTEDAPTGFISNGSFSSSVSAYLADGLDYQLEGSDGMFSYYDTLSAAMAAAANDNGAVITYVGGEAAVQSYTVTIVYGNGTENFVQTLPAGSYTLPTAPTKPGYIFLGWRCGDATYGAGDSYTLSGNMIFYAVWANMPDVGPSEPDEPVVTFPFNDVSVLDWYYDAVKYVYDNELMNGTDVNQFSPNSPLTRAMVWAVLARVDGETISGDSWMTEAQAWAVESGVSDGTDPTGYVTREQLVTMLYRFAGEPAGAADISGYPDAASISDWAADAMAWAVKVGLIEGDDVGALNPTANSTRAHAATFFMRFCEL